MRGNSSARLAYPIHYAYCECALINMEHDRCGPLIGTLLRSWVNHDGPKEEGVSNVNTIQVSARGSPRTYFIRMVAVVVLALPLILAGAAGTAQAREQSRRGHAAGSTIAAHENFARARITSSQVSGVPGIDVSNWQGEINWSAVAADGIKFAYIKATGGTSFVDSEFDDNYTSAYRAGIIRGAYHFARPNYSGPVEQARLLVRNGGGWSPDGMTLPPMLDMEYNPSGPDCYGLSDAEMVDWVRGFSNEVKRLTGRYPVIYTTANWWQMCTGDSGEFNDTNPLMIANWGPDPNPLPNWPYHTIWQYTSSGRVAGINGNVDRDSFNGSYAQLKALATCTNENPC